MTANSGTASFASFPLLSRNNVKNDLVSFDGVERKMGASFTISTSQLFPPSPLPVSGRAAETHLYMKEGGWGGINTSNHATYAANFFHILV
jgi:hypothetical protein